jgi:hypothetical protein
MTDPILTTVAQALTARTCGRVHIRVEPLYIAIQHPWRARVLAFGRTQGTWIGDITTPDGMSCHETIDTEVPATETDIPTITQAIHEALYHVKNF